VRDNPVKPGSKLSKERAPDLRLELEIGTCSCAKIEPQRLGAGLTVDLANVLTTDDFTITPHPRASFAIGDETTPQSACRLFDREFFRCQAAIAGVHGPGGAGTHGHFAQRGRNLDPELGRHRRRRQVVSVHQLRHRGEQRIGGCQTTLEELVPFRAGGSSCTAAYPRKGAAPPARHRYRGGAGVRTGQHGTRAVACLLLDRLLKARPSPPCARPRHRPGVLGDSCGGRCTARRWRATSPGIGSGARATRVSTTWKSCVRGDPRPVFKSLQFRRSGPFVWCGEHSRQSARQMAIPNGACISHHRPCSFYRAAAASGQGRIAPTARAELVLLSASSGRRLESAC